jgi:hypothetical protein
MSSDYKMSDSKQGMKSFNANKHYIILIFSLGSLSAPSKMSYIFFRKKNNILHAFNIQIVSGCLPVSSVIECCLYFEGSIHVR